MALANELVEAVSAWPEVEAITLGGSRATGDNDEKSDYDVYVYVTAPVSAERRRRLLRNRPVTEGPTWGCGFTAPNVRMQYTGESFSEGLQSIATSLTQNSGEGAPVQKGEIFPSTHRFDIGHRDRIGRLFAAWWVELLRRINARVMRLRTGKINHYVLFALAFLALVFLLSLLKLI